MQVSAWVSVPLGLLLWQVNVTMFLVAKLTYDRMRDYL